MQEVFRDVNSKGKETPWRKHKLENLQYAECLSILRFKQAHNVKGCAETLSFKVINGHKKLYQTWFCKKRLCPLCSWRKSMKASYQLNLIIAEALKREPKGRFIFITLTEKNAKDAKELKQRLTNITKAFNKLAHYKKVSKNLLGYLRSTEVTVNEENGSYHQHLHVLLFVKSTYFLNTDNYIPQTQWRKLWQRALKADYEPSIKVEIVKPNKRKGTDSLQASAAEISKYQVKTTDYLTDDDSRNLKVIDDLEHALSGTRQLAFGGIMKQVKADLKLDDTEKGDLINVAGEEYTKEQMEMAEEVTAKWDFKKRNYFTL